MSGSKSRLTAIAAINNYGPIEKSTKFVEKPSDELFGVNVFSMQEMQKLLPEETFTSMKKTIETGFLININIADAVAAAMQDWAREKGASHFAHVFYPLTGLTAERHDSFLSPDGKGGAILDFTGSALIKGEPDASSLPNGGLRQTFEARGYTAWDVTSPAYIMENPNGKTLCIPTVFVSYTGEALDKKTPVLRAAQALNRQTQRILKLFGDHSEQMIAVNCGAEQEYFLVDNNFYNLRPDLVMTGRTLFGAPPPKGQEFGDHYFGAIQERVLAFMFEVERELFKLGIPAKTRHNEVAPGQFELAPVFESANIATDHQQLVMVTLKKMAKKYGMKCLLHEKPFAGINGSGKHVNYSFGNASQGNLLDPGDTPQDNAQFLVFCAAIIQAVHKNAKLLRAIVATAGNDHRLGGNEAPPAIMSIFLGEGLTRVFEQISNGTPATAASPKEKLNIGVDVIPPLPKDSVDRNRTSPFAFTGNRFEFRAVGSDQAVAVALTAISTIVADAIDDLATQLEEATAGAPEKFNSAVQKLLKSVYKEHKAVIFNGDGYSEQWQVEAKKRGLPNLKTSAEALPVLIEKETIALYERHKVLTSSETRSRYEIHTEQYVKKIAVEARLVVKMADTIIAPSAIRYQSELADNCIKLAKAGIKPDTGALEEVTGLAKGLKIANAALKALIVQRQEELQSQAEFCCHKILPAMEAVREYADKLEAVVADDHWALPTYQEMLFVK